MAPENKLDFVPRVSFLPWEWRSLGTLFGGKAQRAQQLSSRCTFTLRQGFDPLDGAPTGRVLQADADAGFSLRNESLALSVTLGNLMYRAGLDDPLAAASEATSSASVPSLKVTLAKEYPEDQFVAVSYDLKQRKPEVSACWSGETYTKKATLMVNLDPRDRVLRLGAALSLPGPEWRRDVYDRERDLIEFVKDDGLRHRVYVTHEARQGDLMHHTRMGLRLDVGRVLNYVADTIDWDWEERIPSAVWRLPLLPRLYGLLIPPEDENQMRYYIKGWEVDVSHDFSKSRPAVALVKNYAHAAVSAGYDFADKEASVEYSRGGVRLGAKVARTPGAWGRPALTLHVEPLSLL